MIKSNKGDKLINKSVEVAALIMDKIRLIDHVSSKRMFGGVGLFHDARMFGIVDSKSNCFFKVDESNINEYINIEAT